MENPENEIVIRYLSGTASEEERRAVEKWASESPENEQALEQFYFIGQLADRLKVIDQVNAEASLRDLKEKIRREKKSVSIRRRWMALQRIAAILFLPALLLSYYLFTRQQPTEALPQYIEVRTNPGMVTAVDLPDGSKVWLNAGGYLKYPTHFAAGHREVYLAGEGYFDVAKRRNQPFLVKVSESYGVEVTGTEFNVSAYEEDGKIVTTLVEGSVQLNLRTAGRSERYPLHPNEKAVFKAGQISVETVDPIYETGWREGKMYFKNLPMQDVLQRLSRYYNVRFAVNNRKVYESIITAKFENEQLPQVLEYIQLATGIKYKIRKPEISGEKLNAVVVELTK